MSEEKSNLDNIIDKAFGMVYKYRKELIDNELYEEVIVLDKLITYVKEQLES